MGAGLRSRFGRRSSAPKPIRRNMIHGAGIGALITLLLASGAGVTFALWTASTTATSSASGAPLAVSTSFGGALPGSAFRNDLASITGTVTVANTSNISASQSANRTAARTITTQLAATIPNPNAAKTAQFAVRAWATTTPATCATQTVPANAPSGTWASFPALTANLAPGTSANYCVRVTASERTNLGVAGGTFAITPTAISTITVAGSSWSATASAPAITQSTSHIYPAASLSTSNWMRIADAAGTTCLDVSGATDAENTALIGFGCKANNDAGKANQRWRLVADGSYYRIVTQLASGRAFVASGTQAGAGIVMSATANDSGSWQLQQIATNSYQLVNKASGLCLTRGVASGGIAPTSLAICAALPTQQYAFTADGFYGNPISNPAMQLSCAANGNGVTIGWGEAPQGATYTIARSTSASGPWTDITSGLTAASTNVTPTNAWPNGTTYLRVTDGVNTKLVTTVKGSYTETTWWGWPLGTVHTLACS
jgi:hypothetical protein